MTNIAYTAGYSGASLIGLKQTALELDADVFDIRLQPWSRIPDWRKSTLAEQLGNRYRHVGALGNVNYRGGVIQIADLEQGVEAIAANPRPVILLCGCRDPQRCHRTVVGDHLRQLGFQVEEVAIPQPTHTIKALTLWQPWASLIAHHAKQYETRSWSTRYRGWLAIHAAKRKPEGFAAAANVLAEVGYTQWSQLPTGCVVAIARLVDVIPTEDRAFVEGLSDAERAFGDFSPGRYAWQFADVRRLEEPIAATGRQGLWDWEVPAHLHAMLGIQAPHHEPA